MIYLIGVEHRVQSIPVGGEETADQNKYRLCLEQAIQQYQPTVVAEEYSEDALKRSEISGKGPQEFFTRKITTTRNVKHVLCDPDLKTKYSMGYQERGGWAMQISRLPTCESPLDRTLLPAALEVLKDFPLRENYWLQRLKDVLRQEVVFVCGDYHVDTFGVRLKDNGIRSQVVERQIGMPAELIEESAQIKAYIERNSQRIDHVFQEILKLNSGKIRPIYTFDEEESPKPSDGETNFS
jgi:hypothetical protein